MRPDGFFCEERHNTTGAQALFVIVRNRGRQVDDAQFFLPNSPAEIAIFEEEEKAFIKSPEFFVERPRKEEASAAHPINIANRIGIFSPLQISFHALRKNFPQERALDDDIQGIWERTERIADCPIGENELGSNDPNIGMFRKVRHHCFKRMRSQSVIRINNEEIFSLCSFRSQIVSLTVAQISSGIDQYGLLIFCTIDK